jgi:hypothetical protein
MVRKPPFCVQYGMHLCGKRFSPYAITHRHPPETHLDHQEMNYLELTEEQPALETGRTREEDDIFTR